MYHLTSAEHAAREREGLLAEREAERDDLKAVYLDKSRLDGARILFLAYLPASVKMHVSDHFFGIEKMHLMVIRIRARL